MNAIDIITTRRVQIDLSDGQGHCWRKIDPDMTPCDVAEDIATAILDNHGRPGRILACDGRHYRWS